MRFLFYFIFVGGNAENTSYTTTDAGVRRVTPASTRPIGRLPFGTIGWIGPASATRLHPVVRGGVGFEPTT